MTVFGAMLALVLFGAVLASVRAAGKRGKQDGGPRDGR